MNWSIDLFFKMSNCSKKNEENDSMRVRKRCGWAPGMQMSMKVFMQMMLLTEWLRWNWQQWRNVATLVTSSWWKSEVFQENRVDMQMSHASRGPFRHLQHQNINWKLKSLPLLIEMITVKVASAWHT